MCCSPLPLPCLWLVKLWLTIGGQQAESSTYTMHCKPASHTNLKPNLAARVAAMPSASCAGRSQPMFVAHISNSTPPVPAIVRMHATYDCLCPGACNCRLQSGLEGAVCDGHGESSQVGQQCSPPKVQEGSHPRCCPETTSHLQHDTAQHNSICPLSVTSLSCRQSCKQQPRPKTSYLVPRMHGKHRAMCAQAWRYSAANDNPWQLAIASWPCLTGLAVLPHQLHSYRRNPNQETPAAI